MLNDKSISEVNKAKFSTRFMRPLYDSYCFTKIPDTIKYLLGDKDVTPLPRDVIGQQTKYNKVILMLIDGFGWTFFEKYKKHSTFLQEAMSDNESIVSKLTTQFPTSTTSNISTLHTGLPVIKSGILEWFYYEPKIDDVYCPFKFNRATDEESETLAKEGIKPESLLPKESIYGALQQQNIKSYCFSYDMINRSSYSSYINNQCNNVDYNGLDEGLELLLNQAKQDEHAYYYFYYPDFDKYCHIEGPSSKAAEQEIINTLRKLDRFIEKAKEQLDDTILLLTADHGLTSAIPENAFYINEECPDILEYLKTKANGDYIKPCGGFRNMFLHIKEGRIDHVHRRLSEQLDGKAEVFKIKDLVKKGIFGNELPTPEFLGRVGDLVILPYKDEAVWWYEEGQFKVDILGQHGGLTKEEIEIPFVMYPFKQT